MPASPLQGLLTNLSSQGTLDSQTLLTDLALSAAEDETRQRNDMMQAYLTHQESEAFKSQEEVVNNFIDKTHQSVQAVTHRGSQLGQAVADQREASHQHCTDTLASLARFRSTLTARSSNNAPVDDESKPAARPQREDPEANENGEEDHSETNGAVDHLGDEAGAVEQIVANPRARARQESDSGDEEQPRGRKIARTWSFSNSMVRTTNAYLSWGS